MRSPLLFVFLAASLAAARTVNDLPEGKTKPEVAGYLADARFLYKLYEECSAAEVSTCLKKKVVVALDRAGKTSKRLTLLEGVSFVKDTSAEDVVPPVSEKEVETELPRSLEDRDSILNQMIFDKIIYFFRTHTLEFRLFGGDGRSLEEGRRRKGINSLLMLPLLIGGTFVPLAFGALALLAGKALIVSKLALALAAIVGLKKLVGGGGESYQVVSVPHHGGHYRRSIPLEDPAQPLVYRAHVTDTLQGI